MKQYPVPLSCRIFGHKYLTKEVVTQWGDKAYVEHEKCLRCGRPVDVLKSRPSEPGPYE